MGGHPRRSQPAGDRLPAVHRTAAENAHRRRAAAIAALASDLPQVWHAPTTSQADRKELLRILIDSITVAVAGTSELVDVTITWAGGHQTSGQAIRPVARLDQLSYYPALLARVSELAEAGATTRQIAQALNAEGFRPPKRTSRYRPEQVRILLNQHNLRTIRQRGQPAALAGLAPGEWSVPGLAAALGMPTASVYNWIYRGWVTARHAPGSKNWIITADAVRKGILNGRRPPQGILLVGSQQDRWAGWGNASPHLACQALSAGGVITRFPGVPP
jgi:hypothetical protein